MATVTPTAGPARLVQTVIRAHLEDQEGQWAQVAVELINAAFPGQLGAGPLADLPAALPPTCWPSPTMPSDWPWPIKQTGDLFERASQYLRARGQPRQARPLAERALTPSPSKPSGPMTPRWVFGMMNSGEALRGPRTTKPPSSNSNAWQVTVASGQTTGTVGSRHSSLGLVLSEPRRPGRRPHPPERGPCHHEAALGSDHPNMIPSHHNLGVILRGPATWPAPAPNTSGPWRSARPPLAPTTTTWRSSAATSTMSCATSAVIRGRDTGSVAPSMPMLSFEDV